MPSAGNWLCHSVLRTGHQVPALLYSAIIDKGQPASVAVGQDIDRLPALAPADLGEERQAVLADSPAEVGVFVGNGLDRSQGRFHARLSDHHARSGAHTVFSTESSDDMLKIKAAVETMIRYAASGQQSPIQLPRWLPAPANRRCFKARELVHTCIAALLAQRRSLPQDQWPGDLLAKLMLVRDEETGQLMSDALLRDESITIFFAGHETTARTLTFLFHALAQNPAVEQRMLAEIEPVLGGPIASKNGMPMFIQERP